MTLAAMLYFFERHHARPGDDLPISYKFVEQRILRRLDAVIGIIRSIEKNHTRPTVELLQSLFEDAAELEQKSEKKLEKKFQKRTLEEELESLPKMRVHF